MKAVVCRDARLEKAEMPESRRAMARSLLRVLRCGICGSDLHARHHCDELADVLDEIGYDDFMRSESARRLRPRVLRRGRRVRRRVRRKRDRRAARTSWRCRCDGATASRRRSDFRPEAPGAYAEQVVVEESLMLPVPNGLAPEPERAHRADGDRLARGAPQRDRQARRRDRDRLRPDRPGRHLHAEGARRAHDRRQRLLGRRGARSPSRCGADIVVDPAHDSPYEAGGRGHLEHAAGGGRAGDLDDGEAAAAADRLAARLARGRSVLGIKPKRPVDLRVRRRARACSTA